MRNRVSLWNRYPFWLRCLAFPFLLLFWFCQNPETESDKILLTLEADSSYQHFSRLWIGFVFEGSDDTLILYDDSLKQFEALHKLSIPNKGIGQGSLVFRGFEAGGSRLVYAEIRIIDIADGNLLSVATQLDLRTAQVPPIPGAPTIQFPATDTTISIGDTLTLTAILADSAGQLRSYAWNFSGTSSFSTAFSLDQATDTVFGTHSFPDTGIYAVSLKVINESRREALKSMTVRVLLDAPTARAVADTLVSVGDTIRLHAAGRDGLGRIVEYAWKIGDGSFQISSSGDTSFPAPLLPGGLTAILRVKDDDGLMALDTLPIAIRASSSAYLKSLIVREASLSPDFNQELKSFYAKVGHDDSILNIDLRPAQPDAQIILASRNLPSGDTTMAVGLQVGLNTIPILVTAQDKKTQRSYELNVTRMPNDNATLKNLVSNTGRLVPDFSSTVFLYTLELENHQSELTLTPSAFDDIHAQIRVKGVLTATGHASQTLAIPVGTDTLPVEVRAENDSVRLEYRVVVTRKASGDATLKNLKPSHGALAPSFDPSVLQYSDTVAAGISSVTLTPFANSEAAKIFLQGKSVLSGKSGDSLSLAVGDNNVRLVMIAQNGDSLVYRVIFHRLNSEARLSDIGVSNGSLTPAFHPDRYQYADTVPSTTAFISVNATAESPVRSVRIQDSALAGLIGNRKINLIVGDNLLSVVGIAEDGTRREYQVTVHRQSGDATLSSLSCNPDLPRVVLQPSVLTYSDTVDFGVDSLRVSAQANHAKATLWVNGSPLASGQYSPRLLLQRGSNTVLVKVTAEDTAITKTYTLNISRRRGFIKTIGGSAEENGIWVTPTLDGGFILAGSAVRTSARGLDALLLKTNASGDTLWSKTFGNTGTDRGNAVVQTSDRGYLLAGITTPVGRSDLNLYWVKTDSAGNTLWERSLGGSADEGNFGVGAQATRDGGFVLCSQTASFGAGGTDIYVVKTLANGDTSWTRTYGGANSDVAISIQQTRDDGYILVGRTQIPGGANNLYLLRLKPNGDTVWSRSLGGTGGAIGVSVGLTADNGFIVTGQNESVGGGDAYLVKTDSLGIVQWSQNYGSSGADWGRSVQQTSDGGYIVGGYTASNYFGPNSGPYDIFLLRINSGGDVVLWKRSYGGEGSDDSHSVRQTADGGFVLIGTINSAPTSTNNKNIYLIRTDEFGNSN